MRILVVTPYYAPDLGPSAPLLTMLGEDLAAMGHQVTVIAAVPHFPTGHVHAKYRGRVRQWETHNGVRVCRVWVPSGNRANLRHRLLTFLVFQLLASVVGLEQSYDVVVITNPALETWLPFALLAWLRRKPSVWCVWDVYPELGVRMGVFKNSTVIALVGALEDFCLRRASAIQVLHEGFIADLQPHAVPRHKMVVVPPWLDTEFIRPLPRRNSFSVEHGLADGFTVLYAGNLGLSQGLDNVLLAAQRLDSRSDVQFVFVGEGACREQLVAQAGQLNLTSVRFIPFQPRERLPEVLASADVSLVSLRRGIGDGSLPSKTFPILASGRPILAAVDQGSGIWNLIQQSAAGVCVLPSDPEALSEAIARLVAEPDLRQQLGRQGRDYAVRHHSRQAAAKAFENIFKTLWGSSSG